MRPVAIAAVLVAWSVLWGPPAGAQVEATFLGNEGFVLRTDEAVILVDALFGDGIEGYGRVPSAARTALETARSPYDRVDLVLASHHHRDHFDAAAVLAHLTHNPRARFVSTRQAVERLRALPGYPAIADRVTGLRPAEAAPLGAADDKISVRPLDLHHGRGRQPPVENLGFLIDIGGVRFLHVGDTEVEIDDIRGLGLDRAGIDVALLPSWLFVYDHWRPVVTHLNARTDVVMHLGEPGASPGFFGPWRSRTEVLRRIRAFRPDAVLLDKLETRRFVAQDSKR